MSERSPSLISPPTGTRRRLADACIVLFLAAQAAIPLSYYLGDRTTDERFSWRMFSSVRMHGCRVRVTERRERGGRVVTERVVLPRELHVAWITHLRRFRPAVVHKLLRWRCEQPQAREVHFHRRCVAPDGTRLPADRLIRQCDRGITEEASP